eukprot:9723958-Heterocapsa_arctica.AAC.1
MDATSIPQALACTKGARCDMPRRRSHFGSSFIPFSAHGRSFKIGQFLHGGPTPTPTSSRWRRLASSSKGRARAPRQGKRQPPRPQHPVGQAAGVAA